MSTLTAIGLIVGGAILLFSGAALSIYGIGLLGAILGGGAGYLLAPTVASAAGVSGTVGLVVAVLIGAVAGILLTYSLLSLAIAAMSFVVGVLFGMNVVAPMLDNGSLLMEVGVALGAGLVIAGIGMFLTRTMMVLITSFIGAALASRSLTMSEFRAAQEEFHLEPLVFELTAPLFVGLFVLGVLSQFGLFKLGYVTKLTAILPGATVLRDKGADETSS